MPEHRLAISGYGKMGKLIEQIAPEFGFTVTCVADENECRGDMQALDVAVDFSVPSAVPGNVKKFATLGVNMVIGTTGWLDRFDEVQAAAHRHDIGIVWSPRQLKNIVKLPKPSVDAKRLQPETAPSCT